MPFEGNAMAQFGATMDASDFESGTKQATNSILAFGSAASKAQLALAGLAAGGMAVATAKALELQAQAAELRKLLGEDMARTMTESILELSGQLPVARRELFAITEQAARLGIRGERNLTRFTETVATLAVATNVSAEEAANSMAKIARVTDTPISQIRNLGAAINELSNNYGTSAQEIIKATGKLAPTLAQLGIAAPEIMGIAAAMNEVNVSVRRGATRLRRVFQQTMNPSNFASIASAINLTEEEFRQMMGSSEGARRVFKRMIAAFATGGRAAEKLRMELSSASRQGLGAIARQGTRVEQAMDDARKAFRLGTSAIIEEMKKSQTAGAQWGKAMSRAGAATAEAGGPFAEWVTGAGEVVNAMADLSNMQQEFVGQSERMVQVGRALDAQLGQWAATFGHAGRGGEEITTILAELQRHVQMLGPEARKAFLDRVIPAIQDTNVSAERLVNGMSLLRQQMQLMSDVPSFVSGAIFPGIDNFFDNYTGGAGDAEDATTKLIQKLKEERAELNKGRLARIRLTKAWKTASDEERRIIEDLINDISFSEIRNEIEKTTKQLARGEDELLRYKEGWNQLTPAQQESLRNMKDLNEILKSVRGNMEDFERDEFGFATGVFSEIVDRRGQLEGQLDLQPIPQDVIDSGRAMSEEQRRLNRRIRQGTVELHRSEASWQELKAEYEDSDEELSELQQRINELTFATAEARLDLLRDTIQDMTDGFFNMFDALVDETEDVEDALSDFIQTISKQIAGSILQGFLLKALTNVTPGGGISIFGQSFGSLEGRAAGGPVSAGVPYVVNERGPEVFVPNVNGAIVPNSQIDSMGGKTIVHKSQITFEVNAMDSQSFSEKIEQHKSEITGMVAEGVSKSQGLRHKMTR